MIVTKAMTIILCESVLVQKGVGGERSEKGTRGDCIYTQTKPCFKGLEGTCRNGHNLENEKFDPVKGKFWKEQA